MPWKGGQRPGRCPHLPPVAKHLAAWFQGDVKCVITAALLTSAPLVNHLLGNRRTLTILVWWTPGHNRATWNPTWTAVWLNWSSFNSNKGGSLDQRHSLLALPYHRWENRSLLLQLPSVTHRRQSHFLEITPPSANLTLFTAATVWDKLALNSFLGLLLMTHTWDVTVQFLVRFF